MCTLRTCATPLESATSHFTSSANHISFACMILHQRRLLICE
jgi:hypothetical protein